MYSVVLMAVHILISQYFWPNDGRAHRLCRHVHALLHGRYAEELPPLRLPFSEFRGAVDAGGAVFEILEVSVAVFFNVLLFRGCV